jgi:phage terminase Nu1 subunit (DNA packaging protein)
VKNAKNQSELGQRLGITQQAVSKLIRHEEWPVKKRGPWSKDEVGRVARWHESLQEDRSSDTPDAGAELNTALKQMKILLAKEQRERIKLQNEVTRGELVAKDMLENALGGLTDQFLRIFDEIRLTFPRRFKMDPVRLEELMDAYQKRLVDQAELEQQKITEAVEASRRRRKRSK